MSGTQLDLTYRIKPTFGPEKLIRMVNLVVEGMFFDEETQFDLMIQKNNDERLHDDLPVSELTMFINPQIWPEIRQVHFSNPWMKGMNLKLQVVRRHDYISVMVKCEMQESELQQQMVRRLEEFLHSERYSENGLDAHDQERERLFGSMLMNAEVVRVAKQPFLAGRFKEAVTLVVKLMTDRLESCLNKPVRQPEDILEVLSLEPPRMLLPDLSGKKLHEELIGISHLCAGVLIMTRPVLQSKSTMVEDPARVLKWMVTIGMLLDRLEGAAYNPAVKVKPEVKKTVPKVVTKKATPEVKGKPAKKALKKAAKKVVAKPLKTKKTAPANPKPVLKGLKKKAAKKQPVRKSKTKKK